MNNLTVGIIGLDTSHVEGFAALLNEPTNPSHVPGARIATGFPGGSPDFPLSADRVGNYTKMLTERFGVRMLESPAAVGASADAILLTSVDGRVHLEQFREIAPLGKPVFIDKPFALSSAHAREIAALARAHGTPLFSSSSLRYCGALTQALEGKTAGRIIGADFSGPLKLQATQPGFFWYGIHSSEMLFAALGTGCTEVRVVRETDHEVAIGRWRDGRIGVVRGNRVGNDTFTGVLHRGASSQWIDVAAGEKPDVGLTRAIVEFFHERRPPIPIEETLELIRFLEAANESRDADGRAVSL